ncbi:MAG: MarR family transcriptional regulator [Oscillospiraceae bacterium]|nr:MarR family transcriptional regulator [Oscillospiraceae bacterium]
MNELKTIITEQLQQLQTLMQRMSLRRLVSSAESRSPLRGQGRVLAMLKMKPEISQRELNYLLGMSKQSLAELLAKLEKSGYITREPSQEDKRVIMIKLTDEGMKTAEEMEENGSESTKILDCLNDDELKNFSEYLDKIIKQYEEQFPDEDFDERRRVMAAFMSHYRPSYERRNNRRDNNGYRNPYDGRSRGK